ncbi:MAG TPA: APC family permease [Candidatus Binatia bacterium]|nr:APC family permease [Candidatus Binatia bacterium]
MLFAVAFAILVTLYFWHTNRIGIPFSSSRALRIMQITTVMVGILIIWCLITIFTQGYQPVPPPTLANLKFSEESLGWLRGTIAPSITIVAILIGLGHSLLAMSGEESLAQVNREIAAPKHQNLIRAGFVIFIYSLVFTSLVSFFAVMIIPDAERSWYFDNLISGISIFLVGPDGLKLAFHAFVVLVGTLILSGAVNTAIIGSNGVLNRVAEDGVLPEWFREPHNKHGTTYRIINLIVILQLLTIIASRGNVYILGEAYAFGVVWSFAMKALAVVVLRFTEPDVQRWRVPLNFRIRGIEVPVGLIITVTLFLLAGINVLTKKTATISGITFTLVFFAAFTIFERRRQAEKQKGAQGRARRVIEEGEMERFRLEVRENLSPASLQVRPGNILVPVHDPDSLRHLQKVLDEFDPEKVDVVVLSVNVNAAEENRDLAMQAEQVVDNYETLVFSRVVHVAEKAGKPVSLVAVAGKEPYFLILQAADKLRSSRTVVGLSFTVSASQQEQEVRLAWERLPAPRPTVTLEIVGGKRQAPIQIDLGSPVSRPSEETRN